MKTDFDFEFEPYLIEGYGAHESMGQDRPHLVMECPWCGRTDRLSIALESDDSGKHPRGAWQCHACVDQGESRSGMNFTSLYAALEGITWQEAAQRLRAGRVPVAQMGSPSPSLEPVPTAFDPYTEIRRMVPEFQPVVDPYTGVVSYPRYLAERNVEPWLAAEYMLGFCTSGRYAKRIILPLVTDRKVDFAARHVEPNHPVRYLNGPSAGSMVYGWLQARNRLLDRRGDYLVIVEGPFDALAFARLGVPVVALVGKSLSRTKMTLIKALPAASWVVCLDATERDTTINYAIKSGLSAYVALLDGVKDPGEATDEQLKRVLAGAIPARQAWAARITERLASLRED